MLLGYYWSSEPDHFDVEEAARERALEADAQLTTGSYTTSAVIAAMETLLNKRGGYLSNDIMPPSIWLDNIPNWEFGVLVQVRDLSRSMRNDFSRSQSQSAEDVDLIIAEPKFNFDNNRGFCRPPKAYTRRASMLFTVTSRACKTRIILTPSFMRVPTICRNGSDRWKNAWAVCRNASAQASVRSVSTPIWPVMPMPYNPPKPARPG